MQAIQTLQPRTCLVKTPRGGLRKLYTLPFAENRLAEGALEEIKRSLTDQVIPLPNMLQGQEGGGGQVETVGETTFHEVVEQERNRTATCLGMTSWTGQ